MTRIDPEDSGGRLPWPVDDSQWYPQLGIPAQESRRTRIDPAILSHLVSPRLGGFSFKG